MKIIKNKRTKWLIIHEHYCQKKKLRERILKYSIKFTSNNKNILTAPKIMSLSQNFSEVVSFFNALRGKTEDPSRYKFLKVDFANITILMPGAALVLAAELYRWQEAGRVQLKPYKVKKWNGNIKRLFNEMGLFDLLQIPQKYKEKAKKPIGSQTFLKFLTGTLSDGELANELMEKMSPLIETHYNEELLYIALSEAMTNVIQHAYPKTSDLFNTALKDRWWLSGSFNSDSKVMSVLLFDQGVGIPSTLPGKNFFEDIMLYLEKKGYSKENQGSLIQAALDIGRSRTKQGHRGKGLKQILNFSSDSKYGSLYIVSRKGEYLFKEDKTETINSHSVELGGTFIQWNIRLNNGV